jgi:serine/threonine protein kinase
MTNVEPTLFIIDFGFAKRVIDPDSGEHIPLRDKQRFIGTPRYASIHAHEGIQQSRRDDIEALGYMLVYLARGSLPWQTAGVRGKRQSNDVGGAGGAPLAAAGLPGGIGGGGDKDGMKSTNHPRGSGAGGVARAAGGGMEHAGRQSRRRDACPLDSVAVYNGAPPVGVTKAEGVGGVDVPGGVAGSTALDSRRQSMRHMFGTDKACDLGAGETMEGKFTLTHRVPGHDAPPHTRAKSTLMPTTTPLPKADPEVKRAELLRQQILLCKQSTPLEELCAGLPPCFEATILHGRTLGFSDMPDYDALNHWWQMS